MSFRPLNPALFLFTVLCASSAVAEPTTTAPQPRDGGWLGRHQQLNEQAKGNQWQLVFIGDSITDGWDSNAGEKVWQMYYGGRQAGNLGIGGDQTQHVVYRIKNGNLADQDPKLAVIMIGTNNLGNNRFDPPDTVAGVAAVVDAVRTEAPGTKILLLGIFPRGEAADDPYRAKIEEVNLALSSLADWQTVHFMDIGHVFLEPDGGLSKDVMHDFLHLTSEGYRRWADAIEPKIAELLEEQDDQRRLLFDGKTLTGWTDEEGSTPPQGWEVVDDTLAVTGWGEDAYTEQQFDDFDFQAEWRLPRKGNGGIFYRVADYRYIWLGPEYQLCDDLTRGYRLDSDASTARISICMDQRLPSRSASTVTGIIRGLWSWAITLNIGSMGGGFWHTIFSRTTGMPASRRASSRGCTLISVNQTVASSSSRTTSAAVCSSAI